MEITNLLAVKNATQPNILIVGPDLRFNDFVLSEVLDRPIYKGIERVTVDLDSEGLDELLANLTESSLFGDQKIIIIKSPLFLTGKKNNFKKFELEELENIFGQLEQLDNPIIIKADYEKLDQRKKLTKLIKKGFQQIETTLRPNDISKVVKYVVDKEQLQIEPQAIRVLIERSSNNIDLVLANLDKLTLSVTGSVIYLKDVQDNVDLSLEENIFEILSKALEHKPLVALDQLDEQIKKGVDPVQLTTIFVSQLTFIFQVKVLGQQMSENDIVQVLKAHPYRIKLALQQKNNLSVVSATLKRLIELEFGYKSGRYQGSVIIKSFILSV